MLRRRPLLRAAAVGGVGYAAGRHMANKANQQANEDAYQDQQIAALQASQAASAAEAPETDNFEQLQKLGEMHEQGILTDEEFTSAKQKILSTM